MPFLVFNNTWSILDVIITQVWWILNELFLGRAEHQGNFVSLTSKKKGDHPWPP